MAGRPLRDLQIHERPPSNGRWEEALNGLIVRATDGAAEVAFAPVEVEEMGANYELIVTVRLYGDHTVDALRDLQADLEGKCNDLLRRMRLHEARMALDDFEKAERELREGKRALVRAKEGLEAIKGPAEAVQLIAGAVEVLGKVGGLLGLT